MDKAVLTNLLKSVSPLQRAEGLTTVAVPAGDTLPEAKSVPADAQTQIVPKPDQL
jgi:hypothetical protein